MTLSERSGLPAPSPVAAARTSSATSTPAAGCSRRAGCARARTPTGCAGTPTRSSSRRSSVSAGSRTSQRMAFSQKRWKARPSSPSPAAQKAPVPGAVGQQRQRASLAGVAGDQHRRRLAVGALQRRVGQQGARARPQAGTRLMPSSGGSSPSALRCLASSTSDVTGCVRPSAVRRGRKVSVRQRAGAIVRRRRPARPAARRAARSRRSRRWRTTRSPPIMASAPPSST